MSQNRLSKQELIFILCITIILMTSVCIVLSRYITRQNAMVTNKKNNLWYATEKIKEAHITAMKNSYNFNPRIMKKKKFNACQSKKLSTKEHSQCAFINSILKDAKFIRYDSAKNPIYAISSNTDLKILKKNAENWEYEIWIEPYNDMLSTGKIACRKGNCVYSNYFEFIIGEYGELIPKYQSIEDFIFSLN